MTWGRTYLWIAILIFAAAASVVARLVEIGEANLIDDRNPISFCNLLFAGNLVAALTLFVLYHREWSPTHLRALSRRQWLVQTALALTSGAIAPAMMFTAIAHTSVTNIVLIETIEIPLGLLLAWLLYREKSNWTAVLGALCALGGVATTLVLQKDASPESMAAARMQGGVATVNSLPPPLQCSSSAVPRSAANNSRPSPWASSASSATSSARSSS